jgi:hypothetical protein
LCAISAVVCIAAINFAIAHPTATFAWTPSTPQVSASAFGGTSTENGNAVAVDAAGNMYTTGYFQNTTDFDPGIGVSNLTSASLNGNDVFVSKLDSSGDFVWAKRLGGTSTDTGNAVAVDAAGNVYTTGYFKGTADFDPGVGTSDLTSLGNQDVFVSKLDSSGNFVWAKSFGAGSDDDATGVAVDAAGNVYTTGTFRSTVDFDPGAGTSNLTAVQPDVFVSKLDSSGNFVWAKSFGGTSTDNGFAIAVDAAGNVYTTGYFYVTADFDPGAGTSNLTSTGLQDIFVSKLDSSGNFVWAKSFGGTDTDIGNAVAVDGAGNVHTTGSYRSTADFDPGVGLSNLTSVSASSDGFVSKLDSSGNFVWAKSFGGTNTEAGRAVAVDAAGNVYTTGHFGETADFDPGAGTSNLTSGGVADGFVSKLDSSGNFVWAKRLGGTNVQMPKAVAIDTAGNVYIAGDFQGTTDFDPGAGTSNMTSAGLYDVFVAKLNSDGSSNLVVPTVSWTEPSSPSSSRTLSYTLVFNTSVTGVAAGDFSNTGTATGCVFTPSGSSGSSVTVSVVCASDGTVVARIAADAVSASGMTGPVSGVSASSVSIDTVPTPTTTTTPTTTSTTTTTAPRTTTTTIGNATTTTVAPSPVATVAVGQISIATIAPSLPGATTTTTASPDRASITTPTPTVQSTIPVPIATVPPAQPSTKLLPIDVPTIPRGGSALRIAGKEVPLKITRRENQLLLNAQNFDAAFSGVRTDGTVIPLDTDGNIRLDKGDAIKVTVTGFAPESQVEIRLYSEPILLGMGAVNDEGSVTRAYQIPETVPGGSHRVVLAGKNYSGDTVVFTVGIVLGSQESAAGLIRTLIAIPILTAIFLALFLPAFLRRRKKPVSV